MRRATAEDAAWLDRWDLDADVIACSTDDPDAAVLAFLEDTYASGANLAGWPRRAFESPDYPVDGTPSQAWSTSTSDPEWTRR